MWMIVIYHTLIEYINSANNLTQLEQFSNLNLYLPSIYIQK